MQGEKDGDRDRYRDSNVTMLYIWSQMFPKGQYVPRFCATVHFTSQGCKVTYISSQMLQKVERAKSEEGQGQGERNSKRNRETATGKGLERQEQGERGRDEEHQGRDSGHGQEKNNLGGQEQRDRTATEGCMLIAIQRQEERDLDRRTGKTTEVEEQ